MANCCGPQMPYAYSHLVLSVFEIAFFFMIITYVWIRVPILWQSAITLIFFFLAPGIFGILSFAKQKKGFVITTLVLCVVGALGGFGIGIHVYKLNKITNFSETYSMIAFLLITIFFGSICLILHSAASCMNVCSCESLRQETTSVGGPQETEGGKSHEVWNRTWYPNVRVLCEWNCFDYRILETFTGRFFQFCL